MKIVLIAGQRSVEIVGDDDLIVKSIAYSDTLRQSKYRQTKQVAVILLGAALGTLQQNEQDIIEKTGYKRYLVRATISNLRKNGIWKKGKTYCEWFTENGMLAFFYDVYVAQGWLVRRS
jgi:hypothetical protein